MFPLYDPEMISLDRTRDIVGELIREVCFEMLQKEILKNIISPIGI